MKDKIIDYLQNELSPTERRALEQALATDPILRTELAFQKDLQDKLRAAQIRKEVESKSAAWETGAADLRNEHKVVQLRVVAGGFALAASLMFVFFNIGNWGNNQSVATENTAPPKPQTPNPKSEIQNPKSEIATIADSNEQKTLNHDPAKSEIRNPKSEIAAMPPPTSNSKTTTQSPLKKKQSSIPPPVESQVSSELPPIPSSSVATIEPKTDSGFLSGVGDSDTASQKNTPIIVMTTFDSMLRVPVKSLVSEAVLLQRFEKELDLKGNVDLQNLVNQYFNATKQLEKIQLPDVDPIDKRLIAARWLLKTMYNFETIGNTESILYCLSKIPEPFFKQEKLLYEQLLDIPNHQNRIKTIIKQFNNEPLNIHYEKSLQLAPYFK